jgi:hypothetical protein
MSDFCLSRFDRPSTLRKVRSNACGPRIGLTVVLTQHLLVHTGEKGKPTPRDQPEIYLRWLTSLRVRHLWPSLRCSFKPKSTCEAVHLEAREYYSRAVRSSSEYLTHVHVERHQLSCGGSHQRRKAGPQQASSSPIAIFEHCLTQLVGPHPFPASAINFYRQRVPAQIAHAETPPPCTFAVAMGSSLAAIFQPFPSGVEEGNASAVGACEAQPSKGREGLVGRERCLLPISSFWLERYTSWPWFGARTWSGREGCEEP